MYQIDRDSWLEIKFHSRTAGYYFDNKMSLFFGYEGHKHYRNFLRDMNNFLQFLQPPYILFKKTKKDILSNILSVLFLDMNTFKYVKIDL